MTGKQREYLKQRVKHPTGTKKDAALAAGYALSTAHQAHLIESPDVKEAFKRLIREKIPGEKIATRVAEGLDAKQTIFFQKDGIVCDSRDVIAWGERRAYAQLAAEYGGYFTPQVEMTGAVVHVLTPAEKAEAAETVKRLIAYDSDAENPIEGEEE
jgi:hypothetical protein